MTPLSPAEEAALRELAEKALVETKGRWVYRRSIFPNDPVNYAYVEWGEKDGGLGTATLSQTMGRYLGALSPDVILRLLDAARSAGLDVAAMNAAFVAEGFVLPLPLFERVLARLTEVPKP